MSRAPRNIAADAALGWKTLAWSAAAAIVALTSGAAWWYTHDPGPAWVRAEAARRGIAIDDVEPAVDAQTTQRITALRAELGETRILHSAWKRHDAAADVLDPIRSPIEIALARSAAEAVLALPPGCEPKLRGAAIAPRLIDRLLVAPVDDIEPLTRAILRGLPLDEPTTALVEALCFRAGDVAGDERIAALLRERAQQSSAAFRSRCDPVDLARWMRSRRMFDAQADIITRLEQRLQYRPFASEWFAWYDFVTTRPGEAEMIERLRALAARPPPAAWDIAGKGRSDFVDIVLWRAQVIASALRMAALAALLADAPLPRDPFDRDGGTMRALIDGGRRVGAYAVGFNGRDDGGNERSDDFVLDLRASPFRR